MLSYKLLNFLLSAVLLLINPSTADDLQDTIYNYNNRTTYVHIQNDDTNILIPFQFNSKFSSGDLIRSKIDVPSNNSKIIAVASELFAIYGSTNSTTNQDDNQELLTLALYNSTTGKWQELELEDKVGHLYQSSYLHTLDDTESIYIYGGYNTSSSTISDRLIRLDLIELKIYDAETSVSPSGFYHSSNVLINYNTQLLVGGKAETGWVSLKQLALWQYESWAFKSVSVDADDTINSRTGTLLLPVFNSYSMNKDYVNNNFSDFTIDKVLMVGGELTSDSYSSPNFAELDVAKSAWSWKSLDTTISLANSITNNFLNDELNLDQIIGATVIYDTLLVISNNTGTVAKSASKAKRDTPDYYIKLYNTTTFEQMASVDYTSFNNIKSDTKSNKSLIIVLSVVIPLLAIIIISIVGWLLYKRHKRNQENLEKEKEIKNIMEFYQGNKQNPSFSTIDSESTKTGDVGNEKETSQHRESYFGEEVKINDFDDGDNLSISSWRRKREMYEKERQPKHKFMGHRSNTVVYSANSATPTDISNQDEEYDNYEFSTELPSPTHNRTLTSASSVLKRSLSSISNNLGKSLRRNVSYQSSIRTFVTAETSFEDSNTTPTAAADPEHTITAIIPEETDEQLTDQLKVPARIYSSPVHNDKSNSTLFLIPENSSLRDFSKSPQRSGDFASLAGTGSTDSLGLLPIPPPSRRSQEDPFANPVPMTPRSGSSPRRSQSQGLLLASTSPSRALIPILPLLNDMQIDEDLDKLDVQVLVSSKRRSKLRVINPDTSDEDESENETGNGDNPFADYEEGDVSMVGEADNSFVGKDYTTRRRVVSDESKGKDESTYE